LHAAKFYIDKSNMHKFPSLVRFVEAVLGQPPISQLWTIRWQEKALTYTPPTKDGKGKKRKPNKKKPKVKHPLDPLPKPTFNLEDWKRAYSNKDTKGSGGSIEWFYEQSVESLLTWEKTLIVPQLRQRRILRVEMRLQAQ